VGGIVPDEDYERPGLLPRLMSILIVALYARLAHVHDDSMDAVKVLVLAVVPVMCVWFPDLMGGAVAMMRPAVLRANPAPDSAVLFFGWASLILPGAVLFGLRLAGVPGSP